jgi:hypothetical protein
MAENDKDELIARLTKAREQISAAGESLRRELDFKKKLKNSFRAHTAAWITGAIVGGLLLSQLRSRSRPAIPLKKRSAIEKGEATKAAAVVTLGKLAFDLLRPTLLAWARAKLSSGISARTAKS